MGIFGKLFEKKVCSICDEEIGLLGNRKLEDGNCCKNCAKKLSPWFEERRHSTVEQIKEQLIYREQNRKELENFDISRAIGDSYKMYIEEVNGVPTRFFVTNAREYMEKNPDIIAFRDVISCVSDIDVTDEEKKQRKDNGEMVSYDPPRFLHHYDFYIEMEIRNNPYFDRIRFRVNSSTVTLETVGGSRGVISGITRQNHHEISLGGNREHRRYQEYEAMCEKICQAVDDGKHCASVAAAVNTAPVSESVPTSAPVQTGPKFCPNCGTPAEGGKFCQNCGGSLTV